MFFFANAARGVATRGLAAISWRSLAGNAGFRFEGTLAPDGAPATPDTGGKSLRRVAREKLRRAARAPTARMARPRRRRRRAGAGDDGARVGATVRARARRGVHRRSGRRRRDVTRGASALFVRPSSAVVAA